MANLKSRHEYERDFPTPTVGDQVWVYDHNAHQYIPEIVDSVIVGNANPYITIENGHKHYELSVVWGKDEVSIWSITFPPPGDQIILVYAPIKPEAIRLAELELVQSNGGQLNMFPLPPVVRKLRLF